MSFFLKDVEGEKPEQEAAPAAANADAHEEGDQQEGGDINDALTTPETEFISTEKKPFNQTAMMLFLIALIGGGGTYFMYYKNGPQSAKAADPQVVKAEATINDFMKGGSKNVSLLRSLLDGTAKIVEQFKLYPNMTQIPLSDLKANPFHFTNYKAAPEQDPEEIAKKKKEEERVAILKSVQTLQLQTVVVRGNRKACMINNTMYQEGEQVDQFTLEKINPNAVVVKSGSYRFELKMSK
jgi:hypothetical protein